MSVYLISSETRDMQIKNNSNWWLPPIECQKNNKRRLILSMVGKDVGNCHLLGEKINTAFLEGNLVDYQNEKTLILWPRSFTSETSSHRNNHRGTKRHAERC